jgi:hypothetical protein
MGFKTDNKEAKIKYNELFDIKQTDEEIKKKAYLTGDEMIKYMVKINDIKDLEAEKKYNEELKLKNKKEEEQYKEIIEDVKGIKKEFKEDKRKAFEEAQKKKTSGILGNLKSMIGLTKKEEYVSEPEDNNKKKEVEKEKKVILTKDEKDNLRKKNKFDELVNEIKKYNPDAKYNYNDKIFTRSDLKEFLDEYKQAEKNKQQEEINKQEEEKSYNQGDGKFNKDFGLWNY